jgi:hypothetical protein
LNWFSSGKEFTGRKGEEEVVVLALITAPSLLLSL